MAPVANISSDDYYQVLGASKDATDAELTKAYRKLALKHHPDKNQHRKAEAEEEFKKITEAYETLHDPEKRKMYDQFGRQGLQGNVGTGSCNAAHASSTGMTAEQAQMFFSQMFGGVSGAAGGPMPSRTRFVFGPGGPSHVMTDDQDDLESLCMAMGMGGPANSHRPKNAKRRRSAQPRQGSDRRCQGAKASPNWAIAQGTAVTIHGLSKAKEHNGKTGTVQRFDDSRGRYEVKLRCGSLLHVRPENVTQNCCVEICDILGKPELNGLFADIVGIDASSGRYLAETQGDSSTIISLKPANCIFDVGTRVKLQGLTTERFNGQMACIMETDSSSVRYKVQCQDGQQIKVKYENVRC